METLASVGNAANVVRYLAGPTGGFFYHLAALRFRNNRWLPFLRTVDRWLSEEWAPSSRELIVFGPSAGWTLPVHFFDRFETVIFVEPDPLARFLLSRRLLPRPRFLEGQRFGGDVNTSSGSAAQRIWFVSRADLLPWTEHEPGTFERFLAAHPSHAVLFSNLLGQLPLISPSAKRVVGPGIDHKLDSQLRFLTALEGREWASYHDILSAKSAPTIDLTFDRTACAQDLGALAHAAFPKGGELTDHETLWLSQNRPTQFAAWSLAPSRHHLIGFVHS